MDGTTTKVGHIRITTVSSVIVQLIGNRIVGKAQIQRMEFVDVDKTFGLPEEAFTNLSDLARGIIARVRIFRVFFQWVIVSQVMI